MKVGSKKYSGLGLLEMIIAMGVAGIALAVFMSMATNTMREAIRYERQDALTRLAMDGSLVVRRHAEIAQDPQGGENFPTLIHGWCYRIRFAGPERLLSQNTNPSNLPNHGSFHRSIVYDEDRNLRERAYVAYCVHSVEELTTKILYNGSVVTGYVEEYEGVQEYKHPVIVVVDR